MAFASDFSSLPGRKRTNFDVSPVANSPMPADRKEDVRSAHIRRLEAEAIHILREAAAEFSQPVLLYSIGKAVAEAV
jgi:sulfate adenylyltransferase subunit 2